MHEKKWVWRYDDYDLFYEDKASIKIRIKQINFSKDMQAKQVMLREQLTNPTSAQMVDEQMVDLEDTSTYFNKFLTVILTLDSPFRVFAMKLD